MAKKLSFLLLFAMIVLLGVKALPAKTFAGNQNFLPIVIHIAETPGYPPVDAPTATSTARATATPLTLPTASPTPAIQPTDFPTPDPKSCVTSGGLTFCNNAWSKQPPSYMKSPSDYIGDPGLVDPNHSRTPGEVIPDWYQISPNSSLYGKGVGADW